MLDLGLLDEASDVLGGEVGVQAAGLQVGLQLRDDLLLINAARGVATRTCLNVGDEAT